MSHSRIRTLTRTVPLAALAASLVAGCSHTTTVTAAPSASSPAASSTTSSSGAPANTPTATPTAAPTATATEASPSETSPAPSPSSTRPPRCTTEVLHATLNAEDAGAGQRYRTLVLTNTGSATCELHGYPGVSFRDDAGTQLGAAATFTAGTARTVVLTPGHAAHVTMHYSNGQMHDCTQVDATSIRVYPPGSTSFLTVPVSAAVCREASVKLVEVGVVTAGSGPAIGADSPS